VGGTRVLQATTPCEIHADEFPWHACNNSEHRDDIQRLILFLYFLKQSSGQSRTTYFMYLPSWWLPFHFRVD
jgi:hypothetical protein